MGIVIFGGDEPMGSAMRTEYLSRGHRVFATRVSGGDADGWIEADLTSPDAVRKVEARLADKKLDMAIFSALMPAPIEGGLPAWIDTYSKNALATERVLNMLQRPLAGSARPRCVLLIDTPLRVFPHFDLKRGKNIIGSIVSSTRRTAAIRSAQLGANGIACILLLHPDLLNETFQPTELGPEKAAPAIADWLDAATMEENGTFRIFPTG